MRSLANIFVAGCAWLAGPGYAQPADIYFPVATFPASTLACVQFSLPSDPVEAARAVDRARVAWFKAAFADRIGRSGPLFVDAAIIIATSGQASTLPIDARLCAVVPSDTSAGSLVLETRPIRTGSAGYCSNPDIGTCLGSAAAKSGYSGTKPWPYLPIYARWSANVDAPTSAGGVTAYLSSFRTLAIGSVAGSASAVEVSTNGLKPLVPCEAAGCPKAPEAQVVAAAGNGIGWFLPAPNAAQLPASASAPSQ